ncbi:MAG TPA: hypothetical protein VE953_22835 [Terriglobales bacterium]|nr:hypothetical protein [Terriglobales bacterium]
MRGYAHNVSAADLVVHGTYDLRGALDRLANQWETARRPRPDRAGEPAPAGRPAPQSGRRAPQGVARA